MAVLDIETLNALSADELAALLAPGSPDRAAVLHLVAEAGHAEAQAALGQMLLDGDELPKDQVAALRWFHKAAEQGHVMAINMIGRIFDHGWGVPVDKTRAAEWYKAAVDRGLDWAMYNYASLLAAGQGVPEDKPAAVALARRAADMGNASAVNLLGSFHEDGCGVKADMGVASEYYRLSAEAGDFRGCFNHARMLIYAHDMEGAVRWLGRVREGAHDQFLDQAEAWLRAAPQAVLRERGVAALCGLGWALPMLIEIPEVLDAAAVARVRAVIDAAEWVDGNATSGHQSALAKRNRQLPEDSPAAHAAGALVLDALAGSQLFFAAALPLKIFPPLFNSYEGGEAFDLHVDNAVRIRRGSDFRLRSDLSATLFLDDLDAYDGGELVIETQFGAQAAKLPAGHMLLYPSSSLHRVAPVTRGRRVASFFWLQSIVRDTEARRTLFELDSAVQTIAQGRGQDDPAIIQLTGVYHNLLRKGADS